VKPSTTELLAGMCIAVASWIIVPRQPDSIVLSAALYWLWILTVRRLNQPSP
jgi:hypothetical protein